MENDQQQHRRGFYQGKLDDPSMVEPLQIALSGSENDGFRVVWNRTTPRREAMDGSRKTRRNNASDAFGTSNATSEGKLSDLQDDEIRAF